MKDLEKVVATFICTPGEDEVDVLQLLQPHIDNEDILVVSIDNYFVTTKLTPEFATFLKLSNAALGTRMNISYITNELKDKYRSRPGPAYL